LEHLAYQQMWHSSQGYSEVANLRRSHAFILQKVCKILNQLARNTILVSNKFIHGTFLSFIITKFCIDGTVCSHCRIYIHEITTVLNLLSEYICRRGQIGDVNGQTGTRVIRWHRGHRAAWEDRLLAAGTRPDCLSGQMFRWCECEGGSDGPGELSYALWGHGGRARRPPDGPDGLGARAAQSPVGERG